MLTDTTTRSTFTALIIALAGCASTPGAKPQDMSKAEHEQAATQHEGQAAPHAGAYNPNATVTKETCGGRGKSAYGGCWTSVTNPTAQHQEDAEKHRKMAADHRAAAQALSAAEAQSCAGISEMDRDMSPFDHREDITNVTPHVVPTPAGAKSQVSTTRGADVTFRAVQGMTAEWLQRIVDCHLARNASLGFEMPEMPYCPLAVKGARAKVVSTGNGFTVTVESDDPTSAKEILRRAQALVSKPVG